MALQTFRQVGLTGEFLKLKETRNLFKQEQHLPSPVIDRASYRGWQDAGGLDAFQRARRRADQLVAQYQRPALDPAREAAMLALMQREAVAAGLTTLPGL